MLKALESSSEHLDAQKKFEAAFEPYVDTTLTVDIGYQGGKAQCNVVWMPGLDLWAHFGDPPNEKGPPNRFWNAFGIGKPQGMVSIACEINPPRKARKYPPAGVFATRPDGELAVLHRGRLTVAGGITVEFVKKNFQGRWVSFADRGMRKEAILVAEIPSDDFGENIRQFVLEIIRVKDLKRRA